MHHLIPKEKSNDNKGKESIDFEILEQLQRLPIEKVSSSFF